MIFNRQATVRDLDRFSVVKINHLAAEMSFPFRFQASETCDAITVT